MENEPEGMRPPKDRLMRRAVSFEMRNYTRLFKYVLYIYIYMHTAIWRTNDLK